MLSCIVAEEKNVIQTGRLKKVKLTCEIRADSPDKALVIERIAPVEILVFLAGSLSRRWASGEIEAGQMWR